MRYLKLFILFLKNNLLVELEYRTNFVVQVVMSVFWSTITVSSAVVLFARTDDIGGWSFDQALLIIGLYEFIGGIVATFLQPNVRRIVAMIRDGTMDFVISKPVNSLFLAALRHSRLSGLMQIAAGAIIFIVALRRLRYVPDAAAIAQFAIMLLVAIALVFSIWIMIATIAFVAVKVDEMGELFNSLWETGKFPITTFSGGMRIALTFVLPIAFMTTFPAQAILRTLDSVYLGLALLMALTVISLSLWLWQRAVRNYSSASS